MGIAHDARLARCDLPGLNKFRELEDVTAHAAPEAVPCLSVSSDVQGTPRNALMMRTIALHQRAFFFHDSCAEQFTRHNSDVLLDDCTIIISDVRCTHDCFSFSRDARKVRLPSTMHRAAQCLIPH